MKEAMKPTFKAVAEALLCAALISCASTAEQTGFLDGYYQNLEPGPKGGARERWLKPGVDYSKFDRVMLDSVVFYFDKNSDDAGIDPGQMKELADTFHKDLLDALKDRYPIVTEPGPGVIRYKIALTGIRQSRPVLSGVSTIIPVGLAASTVKKGATGSWVGSGATSMELLAIDTETNEVIAAGRDEQTAGFTERFSRYGSADAAFKFWAERLRLMMDKLHGESPK